MKTYSDGFHFRMNDAVCKRLGIVKKVDGLLGRFRGGSLERLSYLNLDESRAHFNDIAVKTTQMLENVKGWQDNRPPAMTDLKTKVLRCLADCRSVVTAATEIHEALADKLTDTNNSKRAAATKLRHQRDRFGKILIEHKWPAPLAKHLQEPLYMLHDFVEEKAREDAKKTGDEDAKKAGDEDAKKAGVGPPDVEAKVEVAKKARSSLLTVPNGKDYVRIHINEDSVKLTEVCVWDHSHKITKALV